MQLLLTSSASPALPPRPAALSRARVRVMASADADPDSGAAAAVAASAGERRGGGFPSFLPLAVERIGDGDAIRLAKRIERVPVQTGFSNSPILSSCVRPHEKQQGGDPIVLLHGFDRYTYPLLEDAGLEAWAVDILGWGFSDLEARPPCDVASKREHLYQISISISTAYLGMTDYFSHESLTQNDFYKFMNDLPFQFWRTYIKRPMVLVGPSLGAAVAIDFSVNYPEAVSKLIFIGASVYTEGPKHMTRKPKFVSYAGVSILKSLPLRLLATRLAYNKIPGGLYFDWVQIGCLHCLLPWWEDATVDFMVRGGYNVLSQIKQVKQKCLIIWGEDDGIISSKLAYRLHQELPEATLRMVGQCGHIPHVEKPREAAKYVLEFLERDKAKKVEQGSRLTSALANHRTDPSD